MRPFGNNVTLCPVCGHRSRTLKSDQITPSYREIRYACTNGECTHIFVAELSVVRTLVPSSLPNPLGPSAENPNQHDLFKTPAPSTMGPDEAA